METKDIRPVAGPSKPNKGGTNDHTSVDEPQRPRLISSIYSLLVIVSFFLVAFAAFRNSLTWYVLFLYNGLLLGWVFSQKKKVFV